jgi:hypothetical protein
MFIFRLHKILSLGLVSGMLLKKGIYMRRKIKFWGLTRGMMTACTFMSTFPRSEAPQRLQMIPDIK